MDEVILQCENMSFKRKDFKLEDINLKIKAGYITVITGSNGVGKSTLLSILEGKNLKYQGSVRIYGCEAKECLDVKSDRTIIEKIGHISEEPIFFMERTPLENEEFLSPHFSYWAKDFYRKKLKELGVDENTSVKNLSRGNYVRFQMIWAMAHHAEVYILDEPTAGLDPVYRKVFYKQLQELVEQGAAVVLATNLYEDVEQIADYHVVIEEGRIIKVEEVECI